MIGKLILGVVAIVCVSSYKYIFGAYSIRFFWIVVKYLYLKKLEDLDDKGQAKSPFVELVRTTKCCLLECDFFGYHKNNVTYFTELDLCRTECTLNALHRYFKLAVLKKESLAYVPLASICNHFMKETKPFENYEMRTKVVGWGDKWLWLITVFTGDKVGKRIYCLSLAKLVFKAGRKTLQPWDVVQLAGSTDPDVCKKAYRNEERVAQNTNNVMQLLKVYEEA
ncbi:hypothetical protein PICMEDRAFT_33235 [Pichia membranifaciens NRRL Y-2026]|uniref:Uncharacterized protein n=1 Tax=Pichia membranifaciens NRRL Y-2026 TaxID=763406 RepID=A0A1E3NJJ6_9ASCO|nr:hypothetical protein PICMEDRAFT_33235 [Pichia membranifaciens NRRL Y-2026]ODQ46246.1 hypothetical protein PICMEDRAFT_33235 [Pichia membranifaciens NRRL Y-2026]